MVERRNALTTRDASDSANATVVALPRSAEKVDRDLVERAVSHIRDELTKTVTRGMDEVGRYLLQTFYDNDPELYFSASPSKHASLRLLIERCESMDFPVSRTFLANSLRMAAVSKDLPRAATFRRLPSSHRVELLRLKAPENVERLASKAISQKLSVQKLRALIQKEVDRTALPRIADGRVADGSERRRRCERSRLACGHCGTKRRASYWSAGATSMR